MDSKYANQNIYRSFSQLGVIHGRRLGPLALISPRIGGSVRALALILDTWYRLVIHRLLLPVETECMIQNAIEESRIKIFSLLL